MRTLKAKCARFLVVCGHDKMQAHVFLRRRLFAARARRRVLALTTFRLVFILVP